MADTTVANYYCRKMVEFLLEKMTEGLLLSEKWLSRVGS
jgi:hypothetical protein